jgi:uncharacterized repeat protein (TIGR01451 family)
MIGRIVALFALIFPVLLPLSALAQEKPNVVLKLSVQREVLVKDASGKWRAEWQEVQSFQPGELLKYNIAYTNESKVEARNVVIVDPIPEGTTYVPNGAEGKNAEITFSVDGVNFQVPPLLKYTVKLTGSQEQELFATPEMYRHIRWRLTKPVPAGGTGLVSFKVKVR